MPGITGLHAPGAAPAGLSARLREMERELYPAPGLRREEAGSSGETGFACAVHTRLAGAGVLERHGARLAFDGYLTAPAPRGRELLGWLLDGFLERGPAFLEGLDGSFQIAVHHRGSTWLFADPTASRRLFYAADETGLWFSPEVGPLARLPAFAGGDRIEPANLVQFLLSGRFFAGRTLLPWVRKLLPGESLVWREGHLERRRHFRYEVVHPEADRPGLLEELGELLEKAVLRAWEQADSPVIPLSGGYDSRYIFNTLVRHPEIPQPRWTFLWGERMDLPGSDSAIAREVARRGGAEHITIPWRTELLPEQFEEMFLAQSGMTELIFTHSDELAIFGSLAERGFRTVLRGDECFGPKGEEVSCVPGALSRVAMSRAADVPESRRWLAGGGDGWLDAHEAAMSDLLAGAPAGPSELRDTLYGRERLPALLHHHNYHKLHFVEMMNPFLDRDVLRFWSALPRRHRVDKTLLRESYHARFGDTGEVPIATLDNGADWTGGLRGNPDLAAWVRDRLAALPEPLDRDVFVEKLDAVLEGRPEPPAPPTAHRVPAIKLVARGVVLGEWMRRW